MTAGPRVLTAAAHAAFPLGGIGTGNVSIGARGELRDWEISGRPGKGVDHPYSAFAIHVRPEGGTPLTRVLEAHRRPPFEDDHGHALELAGLPRLRDTRMRGTYPILDLEFIDDALPVRVGLTAFTPFVPLDPDASGMPAAVLRYRVHNPTTLPITVTLVGSLMNPLGYVGRDDLHFPRIEGRPRNSARDDGTLRGLWFETDLPSDHRLAGTACLVTTEPEVTMTPAWVTDFWQDGAQRFWDDLCEDGHLQVETAETLDDVPIERLHRMRIGSLGVVAALAPGATRDIEFLLAWHIPNRERAWLGNIGLDSTHRDDIVQAHYATVWADAWAVARALADDLPALEATTRAFRDAIFESTLPRAVSDALSATLAAARSTTVLRLAGDVFAAWEGSFDRAGSCEGTCTHVWTYAQALAFLFPSLERSARRTEFLHETRPDGRMNFRTNHPFGNEPWDFHPAIDGQMGSIVRLYREWLLSGDDSLLAELWPAAARALDFVQPYWDGDGDGLPDQRQHTTYDIEFYGENPLAASMYLAGLHAGAAIAEHLGETERATRYRDVAARGASAMDARLFEDDYYVQRLPDIDAQRYQVGPGCLSDQLFGQTLAHIVGLGHLLDADHVRQALASIARYNFRPDLSAHESVQRTFALGDDAGLLLCSWPHGGRPRLPFVYCDEVWTGVEYQVAAGCIFEGLVDEGLAIVEGVRDRYDGIRRNPWNEIECGNHYARSLASWAVLIALSGQRSNAAARTLAFAPALPGPFRAPFSTGTAWGRVSIDTEGIDLVVLGGRLDIRRLEVTLNGTTHVITTQAVASGQQIHHQFPIAIAARE